MTHRLTETKNSPVSVLSALARLWRQLSIRRRRQFFLVVALMLLGAVAEVITLGTVVPFLSVLAAPDSIADNAALSMIRTDLGLERPAQMLLGLTILFSLAAVTAGALRVSLAWVTNRYAFSVGHELGVALYERILGQPYSYCPASAPMRQILVD